MNSRSSRPFPHYGARFGAPFLKALGAVEVALGVWVMTAVEPQLCAITQTLASCRAECQRPDLVTPHHSRSRRHGGQEFRLPHPRVGCGELVPDERDANRRRDSLGARPLRFGSWPEQGAFRPHVRGRVDRMRRVPGGRPGLLHRVGRLHRDATRAGHEVVAVDINPAQLAYAERRFAGQQGMRGTAERIMAFGRALAPAAGWRASTLHAFLDLDDPAEQSMYWRRHLDTWRFRAAVDGLLSLASLRTVYASPFLDFLPPHLGAVMRGRMDRCFARHPNRSNPYARALLSGELSDEAPPNEAKQIRLVHADAATYLDREPEGSFDAFCAVEYSRRGQRGLRATADRGGQTRRRPERGCGASQFSRAAGRPGNQPRRRGSVDVVGHRGRQTCGGLVSGL